MKIHQYNEMIRHLTRPKEDTSVKQLAASDQSYNWEQGDWSDPNDESVGGTKILEDFEITDEMRRRPIMSGGRVQMKPGGLVEPGVTHYGNYETTKLDFTSKGEKIKIDVPQLKPNSKQNFKALINGIEKWKAEPTTENWIKIFQKLKGSGKGPQQYIYGWSTELRKYLQGEETTPMVKKIFEQTDIKNLLGLDNDHVKMIKSYKNHQSSAIATRIAKEKALYASAEKAIQINNIFKTNPEITLEALTGEIHKKDFARAGKIGKVEMMTDVSYNVAKYLAALDDA